MDRPLSIREGFGLTVVAAVAALAGVAALPPLAIADRLAGDVAIARLAPPCRQHPGIAVVAVTEDTLAALPYRTPLDRGLLARLAGQLRAKGVRAIGFDVLVDQATEPAKDAAFRQALLAPGPPVVLLAAGSAAPLTARQRRFHQEFLAALRQGHGNLATDRLDGVVRRHFPVLDGVPSLPAAIAAAVGAHPPAADFAIAWCRTGRPGVAFVPVYPAEAAAVLPASWLAGKVVLVGLVVPDTDRHRTPLTMGGPPMAGVEIQAQVLAQLLDGRHALTAPPGVRLAAVVGAAGLGAAMSAGALSVLALIGAAVAGAALLWGAAGGIVALGGPLIPPLAPSLAWLGAIGAASALASVRERALRANLMQLFSAHLSAPVAAEIWRLRHSFLQGGRPRPQRLTATVIFSDIENFTPASERLPPDRLMDWLETYLERMTEVITEHGGIVLRFVGDGILAAFGAPLPRDHPGAVTADAIQAVRAALAMEEALRQLNWRLAEQALPAIHTRLGMVTGPMVGGSIGARRHLEYTLLGDTVNTAARLEGLARTISPAPGSPCRIVVAQSTWERVSALVDARPIGRVALKGKEERVMAYQIVGLAEADEVRRDRGSPHPNPSPQGGGV